jgi:hypothetical protein
MKYIQRTATLVQQAGMLLALAYITLLVCVALGIVNFFNVLAVLSEHREVYSRGGALLVYKGDLYLGIALVFLVSIRGRYWLPSALLISVALVLTLTRGYILSTSAAILMLLVVQRRKSAFLFGLLLTAIAAVLVWRYFPTLNAGLSSNRLISNEQRLSDMDFLWSNTSMKTILIGEGFGSLINDRNNIENTFLWVLWKLGMPGLIFWLMPLMLCLTYFVEIPNCRQHRLACAFLFGTILVYVQTSTNPYLTNPIGLSFVMLSLFSLRTFAKDANLDGLSRTPVNIGFRKVAA